ncbi:MAG TPA: hypothetical protein VNV37_11070, partial [Solirubrobacteraceae bacterium]|nr:hypothetical protein [Solirubrobacteraceae bacterium]
YCAVFAVLGSAAWGGGTIWYARRRGRWPSVVSARLFEWVLGDCEPLRRRELPAVVVVSRRR